VSNQTIVSVIVPTKNSGATLERCLESIKAQTYKALEIIVVDNFSNDQTPAIARQHSDQFYQKGPERCTQRNYGASKAKGTYIAILDSDMYLDENVIKDCIDVIKKPGVAGVIIPERSIGDGFWARCKTLERSFYTGIDYMEAARFFKLASYRQLGGYDESMVSGEDWDFSQRIQQLGKLERINSWISHDEQHISLLKTIQKKYYYAGHFKTYANKSGHQANIKKQTSPITRYWLFLSQPRKLWQHPLLGSGMLFMKTCEFVFGALGMLRVWKRKAPAK
jgi:glycosyltransferase involved in cell wall biosynthesis